MNAESRFPSLFAAIMSGAATVGTALASAAFPSDGKWLEWLAGAMAAGFLYFVKRWMRDREEADQRVMDTLRKHTEQQRIFEQRVTRFMALMQGHLGLHSADSDPAVLIAEATARRKAAQAREKGDGK